MDKNLTEIVFILDRSGSMQHLTDDTIGGFNSFIESQKSSKGESRLTTVLFDDKYEILHEYADLHVVEPITRKDYYTRGSTALLDALGKTIYDVGVRLANTKEKDRPSKVIFVVTTDGYENSSVKYTNKDIKELIDRQTNTYSWKFIFLGANIDSFSVANSLGIVYSANYTDNSVGTRSVYNTLAMTISGFSDTGEIAKDWDKDLV